ncbi:MAG: hypothetical protein U0522_00100 [Candidatus Paceibacterota bacterium]
MQRDRWSRGQSKMKRRKIFAEEQFKELRSMGFRRKTASRILRVTRARLALRSVEWARNCWEEQIKIEEKRDACLEVSGKDGGEVSPTTPELIRQGIRYTLTSSRQMILSGATYEQVKDYLEEFLGVAPPIGPFHEQVMIIDGALMAIKGFPLHSMARV